MSWLKKIFRNLFKKDYSKPSRQYNSHGENQNKPDFSPRWGFIVPHTERAPGARGFTDVGRRVIEYFYAATFLGMIKNAIFFTRDKGGVFGAAKLLRQSGCNASIEPHCNAFNGKVSGYEVLVIHNDSLSIKFAEYLLSQFESKYPERENRGVKKMKPGGRGYNNLAQAKKAGMDVALLTEMFFIDNPDDFITEEEMAEFFSEFTS